MSAIPERKLDFTTEIERQSLRIIAKDVTFTVKWKGRLKPEHFNEPHIQILFRAIEDYVKIYNKLPDLEMLIQHLKKHLSGQDNYKGFVVFATELFAEADRHSHEAVKDCLMDHMKIVDYEHFAIEVANAINSGRHDEIPDMLARVKVRHAKTIAVTPYLRDENDSVMARVAEENDLKKAHPSPWVTFNNKHGGGFQNSAVSAFMGPTGSGKSILLINAGSKFVTNGLTVYHFTFELSAKKTKARYDVCLSGASYAERKANPGLVDSRLKAMKDRGDLYVIQYPTGTCTCDMIEASIMEYTMLGAKKPDVLIVDYLTIMAPNTPDEVDMKKDYSKLKTIAEELRAVAMNLDIPIITALQSNRGSAAKDKIGKEDIADSYAVMHVLDCVLSINQTDVEKQNSQMRLHLAKVRDFEDGYTIVADVDYGNLRIFEKSESTIAYNKAMAKMAADAIDKRATTGVATPLPAALIDQTSANAGLECIIGMGQPSFKRNSNMEIKLSAADVKDNAAWKGEPPPIVQPPMVPTVPSGPPPAIIVPAPPPSGPPPAIVS